MALLLPSTPPGALTDREKLWLAMRELRTFSLRDLYLETKIDRRTGKARDYLVGLLRADILEEISHVPGGQCTYRLVKDCGVNAPRVRKNGVLLPDSGRTRMWRAMPILGMFTVRELVNAASLEDATIAYGEAQAYCQWLARGGYLHRTGTDTYRFIPARNTGPKAPQILRVKQLYDPNVDKIVTALPPEGRDDA